MSKPSTLHLGPGPARLLHLGRVALRPLAQELADNLAAGELGHGVDKGDAAGDALVLGDARGEPVLDVAGLDLALGDVLDLDVGAGYSSCSLFGESVISFSFYSREWIRGRTVRFRQRQRRQRARCRGAGTPARRVRLVGR